LPVIPTPRGRVQVVDGNLVTDLGTPLRGAVLPVDTTWTLDDFNMLTTIAQTTGLNAVHVYLENSTEVTGSNQDIGDALVSLTSQAGLYLILGVGTGSAVGKYDQAKLSSFWALYAARYASSSHVLFEIQNDPENTCAKPVAAATLAMELQTYKQIRSLAPDSHVILFSTSSLIQANVLTDAVRRVGTTVDWTNASFGLDVSTACLPDSLSNLVSAARPLGVSLFIGQLPPDGWGPYITRFEAQRIGWSQFRWFTTNMDLASYYSAIIAAGVSWCPERGTFPEDASTCQ
jgi:hypothetical protein